MTDDTRERLAAALDAPCGHIREMRGAGMDGFNPLLVRECPDCLPKWVAAAIGAAAEKEGYERGVRELAEWQVLNPRRRGEYPDEWAERFLKEQNKNGGKNQCL